MVITGSANSFTADRSWAAYCAGKGGLLMLCRALALDHASDRIRVNIVCPARSPRLCTRRGCADGPAAGRWRRSRRGTGDHIHLSPPYIITRAEIDLVAEVLDATLSEIGATL